VLQDFQTVLLLPFFIKVFISKNYFNVSLEYININTSTIFFLQDFVIQIKVENKKKFEDIFLYFILFYYLFKKHSGIIQVASIQGHSGIKVIQVSFRIIHAWMSILNWLLIIQVLWVIQVPDQLPEFVFFSGTWLNTWMIPEWPLHSGIRQVSFRYLNFAIFHSVWFGDVLKLIMIVFGFLVK